MPQRQRGPPLNWSQFAGKPTLMVTQNGPDDGGDYGPGTPYTATCGVQEAINSLRYSIGPNGVVQGGGIVHVKGTLNLPTNTTGITSYPGIGLVGDGPLDAFQSGTSNIVIPQAANVPDLKVVVDPNYTSLTTFPYVADIAFSGTGGSSTSQHGILVSDVNGTINDFFMHHVLIYAVGGDGVNISNGGKHYFYDSYMEDNIGNGVHIVHGFLQKISRCYIYGNDIHGVYCDQNSNSSGYTHVDNCEVWNNGLDGIRSYPGGAGTYLWATDNRFENNSASGSAAGNSIYAWYVPSLLVEGNSFEDNRGTQFVNYHVNINDSRTAGIVEGNSFVTGKPVGGFFNWNVSGPAAVKIANNLGYNPVGLIASPFDATDLIIGVGVASGTSSPTAGKTYTNSGTDLIITSTGGSTVALVIKDNLGNTVSSGMTTIPIATPYYLPAGWTITWGPSFTGTVTAKVYGL